MTDEEFISDLGSTECAHVWPVAGKVYEQKLLTREEIPGVIMQKTKYCGS